jgi:phosphoenolpyruvate-protein phosphotransferase
MVNTINSGVLTIINETGVHARPAALIFQIAKKYKADISLKTNTKTSSAKSIVAILGLGLKFNSTVEVIATGEDAKQAVDEIATAIKNGLGEAGHKAPQQFTSTQNNNFEASKKDTKVYDFTKEVKASGVASSPGLVMGRTTLFIEEKITYKTESAGIELELKMLSQSFSKAKQHLDEEIKTATDLKQKVKLQIFQAHKEILEDEELIKTATTYINNNKSAAYAVDFAVNDSIKILQSTENSLLIERIADLNDLKRRLLRIILNIPEISKVYPKNTILLAKDLVPSDIAKFDSNIIGVVLAEGSATTHVSLILRNMGTPAIVAMGLEILKIINGTEIIVDANLGFVVVNPSASLLDDTVKQQENLNKIKAENIVNSKKSAITIDGREIKVKGNVSNGEESIKAFELGASGVGLLRSEFLFFNSAKAPSVDEQVLLYQKAVDAMQGESVTIRTLDVGGDKPLPYVHIDKEENPIMGMRGIRTYFGNMEVFTTQLQAIFKIKPVVLVKIMLPMIADVEEFLKIKEIIEFEKHKANISAKIDIGTMIEIPAAAIMAEKIAKYADFLSIGTNDLAQYTMAMDRGNPALASKLSNLSPALLRLIKITVEGGNKYNKSVAVCGAMASELKAIPLLVGLGVSELSTSMRSIPDVKALIRTLNYKKCVEIANKSLDLETAEQVSQLMHKEFNL